MMRNISWLAGLASKIFPRRFAAAKRAAGRRPNASLRSFSDAPLATEKLEPRQMLTVSVGEADPFETIEALLAAPSLASQNDTAPESTVVSMANSATVGADAADNVA